MYKFKNRHRRKSKRQHYAFSKDPKRYAKHFQSSNTYDFAEQPKQNSSKLIKPSPLKREQVKKEKRKAISSRGKSESYFKALSFPKETIVPLTLLEWRNAHKHPHESKTYPFDIDTKSACWWDTHDFHHPPVGCPVDLDVDRRTCILEGFFCSWNCALAYGMHYQKGDVKSNLSWLQLQFAREKRRMGIERKFPIEQRHDRDKRTKLLSIYEAARTRQAPHWSLLQKFGGPMTISEYRNEHCLDNYDRLDIQCIPEHVNILPAGFSVYIRNPKHRQVANCPKSLQPIIHQCKPRKRARSPLIHPKRKRIGNEIIDAKKMMKKLNIQRTKPKKRKTRSLLT